jgi:ferric-chelate reductase (NADPH)
MTDSTPPTTMRAKQPGRIETALIRWLMRPAVVTSVRSLSPRFRLIELEGDALRQVEWVPGQKIQVMLGGLLTARTYTPVMWDSARGRTRILAWSHGHGPGSDWATNLAEGDACQFFGPRRSLDLEGDAGPAALFGDETSFGLALALAETPGAAATRLLFEVSSIAECEPVLRAIGLIPAMLVERTETDTHLEAIERHLTGLARESGTFVLTGRAAAIQRLNRSLQGAGAASARLRSKAYWAPGKTGLD